MIVGKLPARLAFLIETLAGIGQRVAADHFGRQFLVLLLANGPLLVVVHLLLVDLLLVALNDAVLLVVLDFILLLIDLLFRFALVAIVCVLVIRFAAGQGHD